MNQTGTGRTSPGETSLPVLHARPLPEDPHRHNLAKDDVQPLRFTVHHHQPFLLLLQLLEEDAVALFCCRQDVDSCHLPVLLGCSVQHFL